MSKPLEQLRPAFNDQDIGDSVSHVSSIVLLNHRPEAVTCRFTREVKPVPIDGITYSPPNDLPEVERMLGIKFSDNRPLIIILTENNIDALCSNAQGHDPRLGSIVNAMAYGGSLAVYFPPNYTIFAHPSTSISIKGHEYSHAWTDEANPEILTTVTALEDVFYARTNGLETPMVPNIETAHVFNAFTEGIGVWAAVRCATSCGELEEARHTHNTFIANYEFNSRMFLEPNKKFKRLMFNSLEKTIQADDQVLKGIRRYRELTQKAPYGVGYYFVYKAVNYAEVQGINQPDAINLLVKNPPRTIKDLRDPINFVRKLLSVNKPSRELKLAR